MPENNIRTVDILLYVKMTEDTSFEPDINEDGEIVLVPSSKESTFTSVVRAVDGVEKQDDELEIKLTANMSGEDNFDYFCDIDEIGLLYITPDDEKANFESVTTGESLNLVSEEAITNDSNNENIIDDQPLNEADNEDVATQAFLNMFDDVEKQLEELMDKWDKLKKHHEEIQKQNTQLLDEHMSGKEAIDMLRIAREIGINNVSDFIVPIIASATFGPTPDTPVNMLNKSWD